MSLPKINLLGDDKTIRTVMRIGKRYHIDNLVIYEMERRDPGPVNSGFAAGSATKNKFRLCVKAPRKIGNAVYRNRVRRLIKECFRLNAGIVRPSDFVIIVTRKMGVVDLECVCKMLRVCFSTD